LEQLSKQKTASAVFLLWTVYTLRKDYLFISSAMSRVSVYLNFNRTTEEAFLFYREVFGTDFIGEISRMGDAPANPEQPLSPEDAYLVMHVALPIYGDFVLMGSDAPESMGFSLQSGNNTHINLEPESKEEADRIFALLSDGGSVEMPLQDMFWGAYFGSCRDRYGVSWMLNFADQN
jgi:PhnB protein